MKTRIKTVVNMGREKHPERLLSRRFLLVVTLTLGALLGLAEAAGSWLWKTHYLSWRSVVLAGIGAAVMALALGLFNRPAVVFGVALAAVVSHELGLLALGRPLFCQASVSLGLLFNGAFVAGAVWLARGRFFAGGVQRAIVAGTAMLLSAGTFSLVIRTVRPCRDLLAFDWNGGPLVFMLARGVPMALLAGIVFPFVYELGKVLENQLTPLWLRHRTGVIAAAVVTTIAGWLASLPFLAAIP